MAILKTEPGTLRTEAVGSDRESKTIKSKWIDGITTEVVNVKSEGRLTGPTISARFYSMIGTAAYEAWQISGRQSVSSIGLESGGNNYFPFNKEKLDILISATILKVAEQESSGMADEGLKNLRDLKMAEGVSKNKLIKKISSKIADSIGKIYEEDGYDLSQTYTPINSGPDNVIDIDQ